MKHRSQLAVLLLSAVGLALAIAVFDAVEGKALRTSWWRHRHQLTPLALERAPAAGDECRWEAPTLVQLGEQNALLEKKLPLARAVWHRWTKLSAPDAGAGYAELARWQVFLKTGLVADDAELASEDWGQLLRLAHQWPAQLRHSPRHRRLTLSATLQGACYRSTGRVLELNRQCLGYAELPAPKRVSSLTHEGHWSKGVWRSRREQNREIAASESSMDEQMFARFKQDQWRWRDHRAMHLSDCTQLYADKARKRSRSLAAVAEVHPVAACLRDVAPASFLKTLRADLLSPHPKRCDWLREIPTQEQVTALDAYLAHWEKLIERDISQLEWQLWAHGPRWPKVLAAREKLLADLDPTWAYLACHQSSNPKGCYDQNLGQLLKARAPASLENEEILADYPYEAIEARVNEDLGVKRLWLVAELEERAQAQWDRCWRKGPNEMVKLAHSLEWVRPGTSYVDAAFALCLDESAPVLLRELVSGDAPEARFWRHELAAPLRDFWKEQIQKEARLERTWLLEEREPLALRLSADLARRSLPAGEEQEFCETRFTYHVPAKLYFHERRALAQSLGRTLCRRELSAE